MAEPRVLHVVPAVASRYGGPSVAVFRFCRALRALGVDASVATTDADGPGRLDVPTGRTGLRRGVPTTVFPRQLSESFKYSRPLARWLGQRVPEYDLVHVHAVFNHSSLAAAAACRRAGVPYLVRPLGTLSPWSLSRKRIRKTLAWHLGARRMVRRAAGLHATTPAERREVAPLLGDPDRAFVVPLSVGGRYLREGGPGPDGGPSAAADGAAPGAAPPGPYVLSLSRLHPKKRIDALIRAFAALETPPGMRRLRLVIAGSGEPAHESELRRVAGETDLADRIEFPGWVDGARKTALLRGALLFALPSGHENFGIAAAEAMACGVPVMVSETVGLADAVAEARAGWVVDGKPDSLKRALAGAVKDPDVRRARGEAARKLARERYAPERVGRALLRAYRRHLGEAP